MSVIDKKNIDKNKNRVRSSQLKLRVNLRTVLSAMLFQEAFQVLALRLGVIFALSLMMSTFALATPSAVQAKAPSAVTRPVSVLPATQAASVSAAPAALPAVRVLIKAAREARIASQISGRITALPVKMGRSFRRGDLLVGFDCTHQDAEQAAANAMLTKANTVVVSKKSLAAMKAVSDIDVQLAEADLAQARAQLSRAVASVADCRILAPYDGSVVNVVANHAEFVGPGSPLIEIVERGNLHVEALIRSAWLTWLRPGQRFTITVDELGRDVVAVVASIGARVDPVSQTIPVMGKIVQEVPGLRAGMSGNAKFVRVP